MDLDHHNITLESQNGDLEDDVGDAMEDHIQRNNLERGDGFIDQIVLILESNSGDGVYIKDLKLFGYLHLMIIWIWWRVLIHT